MSVDMLAELIPELKRINSMLEGIELPTVNEVEGLNGRSKDKS